MFVQLACALLVLALVIGGILAFIPWAHDSPPGPPGPPSPAPELDWGTRGGSSDITNGDDSSGPNVDCSVSWDIGPCVGDCYAAVSVWTGTVVIPPQGNGKPCPAPLVQTVSCKDEMPCLCAGADLPIEPAQSLTTCSNCDYLQPGQTCYVGCADPGQTMLGIGEFTCADGVWTTPGLPPSCVALAAECPAVRNYTDSNSCYSNGILPQAGSTCIGAVEGDVCRIACAAGYAVPSDAAAAATCQGGSWSANLLCVPQVGCVGGSASGTSSGTSSGQGCDCGASCCPPPSPSSGFGAPPLGSLLPERHVQAWEAQYAQQQQDGWW